MENSMMEAAHTIVTDVACLKEDFNVLIVCGLHNKNLAEYITLESYAVGAYPYLWVFDEKIFSKHAKNPSENVIRVLPKHVHSLLRDSDVIIWLSQFGDLRKIPKNVKKAMFSFWASVNEAIEAKPRLYVNLLSSTCVENMGINYKQYLQSFVDAVNVNYAEIRKTGTIIASKLYGKSVVHVYDDRGTDLTFSIKSRPIGIEVGTLEECFSSEKECAVDVPGGEVYVAPIETSANGVLVVDEFRDYKIQNLELHFQEGKVANFKAEKGSEVFRKLLDKAEGEKDRIAELGIGINHGMKLTGYRLYDEKALGTAHIAIGHNVHLGGVNKASIHWDFILQNPTIETDNKPLMEKGKMAATCKTI
ncbi:MAG: aminopeptidase [Candidatus Bathyarchaeia archaeon]